VTGRDAAKSRAAGLSLSTAVNVRTYPPITHVAVAVSPRYLHQDERVAVADGFAAGESIRSIARRLDRDPSTISRESTATVIRVAALTASSPPTNAPPTRPS